MKIIKEGNPRWWRMQQSTCTRCGTCVEFSDQDDLPVIDMGCYLAATWICPICQAQNSISTTV